MIRRGKAYSANEALILAGTGSNCTAHAVDLAKSAQEAGADGLLVVSPYYNKANTDGLLRHYISIAHAVSIPVILYNVPGRTGLDIPVSIYERLSRIPNIAGVKEASADITKITRIRQVCAPGFSIWSGNDDQAVPAISLGAQGVISVTSNIEPEKTQAMCLAAMAGDLDTAASLQLEMQELADILFCEVNPVPVKAAMKCCGYDCGPCRLPLGVLSKENQQKILDYFRM